MRGCRPGTCGLQSRLDPVEILEFWPEMNHSMRLEDIAS